MKKILLISLIVIVGIAGFGYFYTNDAGVGADGSKFVGSNVLFLSSGITSTQTTITLTKFQVPNTTQPIQMTDFGDVGYITLEPGRTKREFISFTGITQNAGGTATLTGVLRGLAPIAPYTASTTHQQSHSGGVQVIVSNPPQLYNDAVFKANDETITGLFDFTGQIPTATLNATTSLQLINKATLDATVLQGAATSTETNGGIVELATQIEQASTTDDGTGNKPLGLYAKYSTSTPDGTSQAGLFTVISKNNGKLHQLWLDLTESFTWTGAHIFNTNEVTINAGLTVNNATSTNATTTAMAITGSLDFTGSSLTGIARIASTTTFTSSGTYNKSAGVTRIFIQANGGGGSGANEAGTGGSGGGGGGEYRERWIEASDVGATETVTIGAGGAAVSTGNTNGNGGGATTFGSLATANGGGGGVENSPTNDGTGGSGGSPFNTVQGIWGIGGVEAIGENGKYSAGGGGSTVGGANRLGGNSIEGGAGGGGANGTGGAGGGTSTFGGNGGAGAFNGNATAGTAPGGGGGANAGTGDSGAGGGGQMIITEFF